jgi:hypothetical protein
MDIYEEIRGLKIEIVSLREMLSDVVKSMRYISEAQRMSVSVSERRYLSGKEAALYLDMSTRTFQRHKGKFPFVMKAGSPAYKIKDLDDYLNQRTVHTDRTIDFAKVRKVRKAVVV